MNKEIVLEGNTVKQTERIGLHCCFSIETQSTDSLLLHNMLRGLKRLRLRDL